MRTSTVSLVASLFFGLSAIGLQEECMANSPAGESRWSTQDTGAVIDAVLTTAEGFETTSERAKKLAEFADVLVEAGRHSIADSVLAKASALLESPNGFGNQVAREKIIASLVHLEDLKEAEALAAVDAEPQVRAALFGKLGKALAEAGNTVGALRATSQILTLDPAKGPPALTFHSYAAITQIGIALAARGAVREAVNVAAMLPNGLQRQRVLGQAARYLCAGPETSEESRANCRDIAEQAVAGARIALGGPDQLGQKSDLKAGMFEIAVQAAATIALCEGAVQAADFAKNLTTLQSANAVLDQVADDLIAKGEFDLARALAPTSDAAGAKSLIRAAVRLLKQGEKDAAKEMAIQASRISLEDVGQQSYSERQDVFEVLRDTAAYDAAITLIQSFPGTTQSKFYRFLLLKEIENKAVAAVAHTLPMATHAFREGNWDDAFSVVTALARNGFRDEAKKLFEDLEPGKPFAGLLSLPKLRALFRAEMGDIAGALAAANDAGPLVTSPSALQIGLLTIMQFDAPRTQPPTMEEIGAAADRAKAAFPSLLPGPKADALEAIVSAMTAQRNLNAAQQAEAQLEAEPRDVLAPKRDSALASIAALQTETGDLRGAFRTALKITESQIRWKPLLKLISVPPDNQP